MRYNKNGIDIYRGTKEYSIGIWRELNMEKDKRKLTDKELKRKDHFEKLNAEMQKKGYQMKRC